MDHFPFLRLIGVFNFHLTKNTRTVGLLQYSNGKWWTHGHLSNQSEFLSLLLSALLTLPLPVYLHYVLACCDTTVRSCLCFCHLRNLLMLFWIILNVISHFSRLPNYSEYTFQVLKTLSYWRQLYWWIVIFIRDKWIAL